LKKTITGKGITRSTYVLILTPQAIQNAVIRIIGTCLFRAAWGGACFIPKIRIKRRCSTSCH